MSHPFVTPVMVCLILFLAAACCGEKTRQERPPDRAADNKAGQEKKIRDERINAEKRTLSLWMRANTGDEVVPAAAAAAVSDGRAIFSETVNCAPSTLFQAASLTKTFTALTVLHMADRGIISLDEPISTYLGVKFEAPGLNSDPITVWHLLTHTSGLIEDPDPVQEKNNYPFVVPQQKYPTGYRFNYCNQGYNLLGFIVFEASGMPLGDYVTRNILAPLGMKDSKAPVTTRGASGIRCSLNDLVRYMQMFLDGGSAGGKRIISKRMFDRFIDETIETPRSRKKEYRGLCFRVWSVSGRVYSMHHAAHMPGAGGFMQLFPRHNAGYVFISNPPVYDREEYYGYYYGLKSRMLRFSRLLVSDDFDPVTFEPDKPGRRQLESFVGRYRLYTNPAGGRFIDIELNPGGYLVAVKSYTGARVAIVPTSLHTFVYIYPGQTEKGEIYDFVMKNGKVVGLGVKEGYFIK